MGEKLHSTPENRFENIDTSAELKRQQEKLEAEASKEQTSGHDIEQLKRSVEHQALSGKEVSVGEKEKPVHSPIGQQKDMKNLAYKRTLSRVQGQLSAPERTFSKVVHSPAVEKVSNVGAQTVARPSGILGGGIAAMIGTGFVLYYSKRYGFDYNYLLFILLFVAGFTAGVAIELILKLFRRNQAN